jgi:hypothetical protein
MGVREMIASKEFAGARVPERRGGGLSRRLTVVRVFEIRLVRRARGASPYCWAGSGSASLRACRS